MNDNEVTQLRIHLLKRGAKRMKSRVFRIASQETHHEPFQD